jgi:hypothetical protein
VGTALESIGCDMVRIRLKDTPAGRSTIFLLPGRLSCTRGYVEDWLRRGEAERKSLEVGQRRDVFWIPVLTVALGIVAAVAAVVTAWPVVRDWIK